MKIKLLTFLLFSQSFYSQNDGENFELYNDFFLNLKTLNFEKSIKEPINIDLKNLYILYKDNGQSELDFIDKLLIENEKDSNLSIFSNSVRNLNKANYLLLYKNERINSFKFYMKSLSEAKKCKYPPLIKLVLRKILNFYLKGNLQNDNNFKQYLNMYKYNCKDKFDFLYYYSYLFKLTGQTEIYEESYSKKNKIYESIFKSYDSLVTKNNFSKLLVYYYGDKGNLIIRKNPKKAKVYYNKQLNICTNSKFYKAIKYVIYCNLSRASSLLNKHKKGLEYLKKAEEFININDTIKNKLALSIYRANHYSKLKKLDSAYYFSEKVRKLGYLYNFQKHNTEVSKIKLELETERKEKENLQLKIDKEKNQKYLLTTILIIILGGTIGTLFLKNSKRKRKLLEQEKEIESQKNLTLLKEQELTTINAMVDGQEKERKRIAEDLHDNLGSVLATLKLHFENLQMNKEKKKINQDELFNKTESLIDEAYLKVRSIAHAKNAGVIANQGLLTAVKMMAEKISSADKITIEVIHFGLDKRLENSLEITVFRIIQELITNVIKHAEATNATINISVYDNNLNIIVEDNGKGFNIKNVNLKDGMGIGSIKTRIEHLKGTFEIDSTTGKGSSVIIDIPIG